MSFNCYAFSAPLPGGLYDDTGLYKKMERGDRICRTSIRPQDGPGTQDVMLWATDPRPAYILVDGYAGQKASDAVRDIRRYGYKDTIWFFHDTEYDGEGVTDDDVGEFGSIEEEPKIPQVMHPQFSRPLPLPGTLGRP